MFWNFENAFSLVIADECEKKIEVTDLAKCWKVERAEAPEKLSESANFESHAALNPALRNSKLEKLSENLSEKL